jgi:hypothetical protein
LHNCAGVFALGVAWFPMVCPFKEGERNFHLCVSTPWRGLHYTFAITLFLFAIASIIYGGGPKLRRILSVSALRTLDKLRAICGLIIALGVLVPSFLLAFVPEASWHSWVIFSEGSAFAGFGAYWATLTWCVAATNSERKAKRERRSKGRSARQVAQAKGEDAESTPVDVRGLGEEADEIEDIP